MSAPPCRARHSFNKDGPPLQKGWLDKAKGTSAAPQNHIKQSGQTRADGSRGKAV